MSIVCVIRLVR
ncbi:hypothetical protein BsWGS_22147 [Bradybaena similaris]